MTQNGDQGRCRDCRFCRAIGEALHCVRNAPAPAPASGQALWPRVGEDDYCGQFQLAGASREASLVKREAELAQPASGGPCPVTRSPQLATSASRDSSRVARRSQRELEDQSGRDAASDPNRKSSIVDRRSQIGLPICEDEFGPYCQIPLTQNRCAKVDPEDYLWLSQFRWCCKANRDTCYAIRHIQEHGRTKRIHMHRQIMNTPDNMICDHKRGCPGCR